MSSIYASVIYQDKHKIEAAETNIFAVDTFLFKFWPVIFFFPVKITFPI